MWRIVFQNLLLPFGRSKGLYFQLILSLLRCSIVLENFLFRCVVLFSRYFSYFVVEFDIIFSVGFTYFGMQWCSGNLRSLWYIIFLSLLLLGVGLRKTIQTFVVTLVTDLFGNVWQRYYCVDYRQQFICDCEDNFSWEQEVYL